MQSGKFRNKYRIDSIRAKWWNYSNPGRYFVTICTKQRIRHFGKIKNGEMFRSVAGEIAHQKWIEIPKYYDGLVQIDEFVIMPDHMHGIIIINPAKETTPSNTHKKPTLGQIINQYKRACTIDIKKQQQQQQNHPFAWQSRYYDIIIKDQIAMNNIRKYIQNNPRNYKY